jgi:hypothetical protein
MPGFHSSHDTTVSFNGVDIGYLTAHDWDVKAGQLVERTSVVSRVVGAGADARVVKRYDCTSVEPPTLSFSFWGPPSFDADDAGMKGTIVFETPGATISGPAILTSFSHAGRSGQWSTGVATFQLTGALE